MAVPLSQKFCRVLRRTLLSRDVHSRLGLFVNFTSEQTRSASTYRAAVLKELKKPLVIENVNAPKKIKKDEVCICFQKFDVVTPLFLTHDFITFFSDTSEGCELRCQCQRYYVV